MRLAAATAVLNDVPAALRENPEVHSIERPATFSQTVSEAAAFAIEAAQLVDLDGREPALFCITGTVGSSLHYFDKARESSSGRLLAPGFARRSRRVHPFTVLLALQNQVAAELSLHFGWKGPCSSSIDSAAAFVDLLPNIESSLEQRPALVVMSSAAGRSEDRSWVVYQSRRQRIVSGAVALLFEPNGRLGDVRHPTAPGSALRPDQDLFEEDLVAPQLEAGLAILWSMGRGLERARFEIGPESRQAHFEWSRE